MTIDFYQNVLKSNNIMSTSKLKRQILYIFLIVIE